MHYYGLETLVLVELRSWTIKDMDADVAIFDILGGTIISVLLIVASRTKSVKTPVVEGLKGDGDCASRRNAELSFEMNQLLSGQSPYDSPPSH